MGCRPSSGRPSVHFQRPAANNPAPAAKWDGALPINNPNFHPIYLEPFYLGLGCTPALDVNPKKRKRGVLSPVRKPAEEEANLAQGVFSLLSSVRARSFGTSSRITPRAACCIFGSSPSRCPTPETALQLALLDSSDRSVPRSIQPLLFKGSRGSLRACYARFRVTRRLAPVVRHPLIYGVI